MTIRYIYTFFCWCLINAAWAKPEISIQFLDDIEISAETILLKDIAVIAGGGPDVEKLKTLEVGRSANFGLTRYLSTRPIYTRHLAPLEDKYTLKNYQEKRIRIKTTSREYARDSLKNLVEAFLKENFPRYEEIDFEFLHVPKNIHLPSGPYKIRLKVSDTFQCHGRQSLEIIVKEINGRRRVQNMAIYLRAFGKVLVAASKIRRKEKLTAENIRIEKRDITAVSGMPLRKPSDVLGQLAKQTIIPGRIITTRLVELDPVIKSGDEVTVISDNGPISISINGIARQDGQLGQIIQVKNLVSLKLVRGRVLEAGILELVKLSTRG